MNDTSVERVVIDAGKGAIELEIQWIARERRDARLIVFLHEGLGSVAIWGDWPQRLCDATGCRGLVFSRYGYGHSTPRPANQDWPHDYLEYEAKIALPALFAALGIDPMRDQPILFGHSDGGTIALLFAAAFPNIPAAIVILAPHVFTEAVGRARILQLQKSYDNGALREKLAQLHDDPDGVFWGWSRLWVAPDYQPWNITALLSSIACPVLMVQGRQDQYGTLDQLEAIKEQVPHAHILVLEECRHVPHLEQPQALLAATAGFLQTI